MRNSFVLLLSVAILALSLNLGLIALAQGLAAVGEGIAQQNVRVLDRQYEIFMEQKRAAANELQELRREPRQQ